MSKIIHVLHVTPTMKRGGVENYIMNMYRNIDRTRIQFDFLEHYSSEDAFDTEIKALGGHIYHIPFMEYKSLPRYCRELDAFFARHQEIDVVHGHMGTTAMFYLAAAKRHGIRNRLIHAHEDSYIRDPRGYIRMILIKQSWRNASQLCACSTTSGHYYYGNRPFTLLKNAIDTNRFVFNTQKRIAARASLGLSDSAYVIGHIGRFAKQKNHQFLIKIFAEVLHHNPRAILLMVGEGELKEEIQSRVTELGMADKVIFAPVIETPELYYNAMDLFALPSNFEGLPLVGIEAQCNGLPVLFADTISKEADLARTTKFLPINSTEALAKWSEIITAYMRMPQYNRECNLPKIKEKGYDARLNAARMMDFYCNLVN